MQLEQTAVAEFRRMLKWIVVIAILMVAAALTFLAKMGSLTIHMVIATVAGTFVSVLLGCGLFALAFFSDKSGHDQTVSDATERQSGSEGLRSGEPGADRPAAGE
jgi:uncharacterized membrane protein YbjE (DUF340 family)